MPDGRLLLAFSGGEDSLFLMSLLSLIAPERSAALYVNHGIRSGAELEREEAINAHNASLLGIPLVIKRIPEGDIKRLAKIRRKRSLCAFFPPLLSMRLVVSAAMMA